jgi:hypothetical protein
MLERDGQNNKSVAIVMRQIVLDFFVLHEHFGKATIREPPETYEEHLATKADLETLVLAAVRQKFSGHQSISFFGSQ